MGFAWSSYVAQETLLSIADVGGLHSDCVLAEDRPLPDDLDGRDLTPVLRGDVDDWSRVVFTDGWVYDSSDRLQSSQVMATDGKARLTVNLINMAEELLDVSRERTGARQENLLGTLDGTGLRVPLHLYLDRATTVPPQN